MLLIEKIKATKFSPNETIVINYIFEKKAQIQQQTIREIAANTFVHPSTLIRIAKKLEFSGWNQFKEQLVKEFSYVETNFIDIDPNIPFDKMDNVLTIANKIANLEKETIEDTRSLLSISYLEEATNKLINAEKIIVFGNNSNLLMAQDFILKMGRIGKVIIPALTVGESMYNAYSCHSTDCCLLISYSGESIEMLQVARILKQKRVSIVSLTSIGDNSLTKLSDVTLNLTTRERLYSKIGNYTINESIFYLLNVLYSCCFSKNYSANLLNLIRIGERIDTRKTNSHVMEESIADHNDLLN